MKALLAATLALLTLFALLVGLIRAQPQDTTAWRTFLLPPEDCPMPCWQGIRPSMTTVEETITVLQAHPWTRQIITSYYNAATRQGSLVWAFNAPHPDGQIAPYQAEFRVIHDVVSNITVTTDIPASAIWFLFGVPSMERWAILSQRALNSRRIDHFAHYINLGFSIYVPMTCPVRLANAWMGQTVIQYGPPINRQSVNTFVQASHFGKYDPGWLLRHQTVCLP